MKTSKYDKRKRIVTKIMIAKNSQDEYHMDRKLCKRLLNEIIQRNLIKSS